MQTSPEIEKRICAIFDSVCKIVIRNFSRNLKRAAANQRKHFSTGSISVQQLLNSLTIEDEHPSDQYVIYVENYLCVIKNEILYYTSMSNIVSVVSTFMENTLTEVTNIWNNIQTNMGAVLANIGNAVKVDWNTITASIKTSLENIKTAISTGWTAVKNIVSSATDGIRNMISTVWNGIKSFSTHSLSADKSPAVTAT